MASAPIQGGPAGRPSAASKYAWSPSAATAIGAVKPASSETQPARNPASGCTARESSAYSPPESGSLRPSAP